MTKLSDYWKISYKAKIPKIREFMNYEAQLFHDLELLVYTIHS